MRSAWSETGAMGFPLMRTIPPLGTNESDVLDFKATVKAKDGGTKSADRFELAKDVSALANTLGGTVLVGACGGSTLSALRGFDDSEATWIGREYEEAARDRCEPAPSFSVELIVHEGKTLVAVHVLPSPFPVSVRVRADKDDGYGDSAWVFFHRVASQTKPMTPQVAAMMTTEIRRIAILLRSIPANDPVDVALRTEGDGRQDFHGCRLGVVEEMENRVTFIRAPGQLDGRLHSVPLDHVRTAFKRHDGRWIVDVDHFHQARSRY